LALLIGCAAVSGLAWFFAVLIVLGLSAASGPAHRIDFPFFAAILALGLILVVAVMRDLVSWLRRRSDRDVDAWP
jgi:ABC-type multidrug transport system permease subunit